MDQIIDEIIKKAIREADQAEVYMEQEQSTNVDMQNDKVNHAKEENIKGIGIRVLKDQRQGFAYTTDMNRIDQTIKQAIFNSKLNSIDENNHIPENKYEYKKVKGLYDNSIKELDVEKAVEFTQSMIDVVKENKCDPTSGGYGLGISTVTIRNSNGIDITESTTICGGSIAVNVPDGDVVSSGYYHDISHKQDVDPEELANKASKLALDSRNPKPTETKDTTVILDYGAAVSLLDTFMGALSSENTQRGRSRFQNKIGETVTSTEFSLYDDGTIPGALQSSISDDEGVPTQKTILIEDGVLKNFIYDTYHARKENNNVKSTGNAVRAGYTSTPQVGFSNLQLNFENVTPLEEVTEGIVVNNVMGAHTANPISGDFSVEALNTFKIENGSIVYPIEKAMISGNIFDIMKNVTAATKNTRQLGSCITPKLLIENLRVIK